MRLTTFPHFLITYFASFCSAVGVGDGIDIDDAAEDGGDHGAPVDGPATGGGAGAGTRRCWTGCRRFGMAEEGPAEDAEGGGDHDEQSLDQLAVINLAGAGQQRGEEDGDPGVLGN